MIDDVAPKYRPYFLWLAAYPALLILLTVVVLNTSHALHAQMLQLGENIWEGYFQLRTEIAPPSCNPHIDIEAEVAKQLANTQNKDDVMDLFDEPEALDADALKQALLASKQRCIKQQAQYQSLLVQQSLPLKLFRNIEQGIAKIGELGISIQRIMLALLVIICGLTAMIKRHHIALRPAQTVMDYRLSTLAQFIASSILLYSVYSFKQVAFSAGVTISLEHRILHHLWIVGFAILFLLNIYQLIYVPKQALKGGNLLSASLTIPLYAIMCLISGSFFIATNNSAGIGIYLNQMIELSQLFLNVGLYVWIGMLFKRTKLADAVFNLFRPLNLPPEVLAISVVALAAVPTAYTGASGIFVIAIGGLIYFELRKAGARRQLALAATAISGSLGVVLRPCLLVVIIAALNNEVTTNQLFGWGAKVFWLTMLLFALFALLSKQERIRINPSDNWQAELVHAVRLLLPYVLLLAGVIVLYALLLNTYLDEFFAPFMLPVLLIAILKYENWQHKRSTGSLEQTQEPAQADAKDLQKPLYDSSQSLFTTLTQATTETTIHIGALLFLMGLSVSIGGVIERSDVMLMLPTDFQSIWVTMFVLVVALVIIGMIMDPYGAVILVSATIAGVAYKNGIHPVHFWVVTLVAFELGYLSPPVALNHLLTRQVVGEKEVSLALQEGHNFWYRHERILLPIVTMGTALILVAFVPLLWQ